MKFNPTSAAAELAARGHPALSAQVIETILAILEGRPTPATLLKRTQARKKYRAKVDAGWRRRLTRKQICEATARKRKYRARDAAKREAAKHSK